jgi:APA family basic amino acid/polyamine antiporter
VWILRIYHPEIPRPFRIPAAPLICFLGVASCLILLSTFGSYNWWLTTIWTTVGFVLYFSYSYRHSKLHREFVAAAALASQIH